MGSVSAISHGFFNDLLPSGLQGRPFAQYAQVSDDLRGPERDEPLSVEPAAEQLEGEEQKPVEPEQVEAPAFEQNELSEQEKRELAELKRTDREVRAHEQAHRAAGGQYVVGGPSYVMEMGPDGKMYAVGGEVKLDVSEVPGDPEATVRKMEQVRRAALAPLEPSPQDLRVAAIAAQEATEARIEAAREEPAEPGRTPPNFGLPVVDFAEVYFGNFDAFPAGNMVDLFA